MLAIEVEAVEFSRQVHEFGHLSFTVDSSWRTGAIAGLPDGLQAEAEGRAGKFALPDIAGRESTQREKGHFRFSQTERRAVAFHTVPVFW